MLLLLSIIMIIINRAPGNIALQLHLYTGSNLRRKRVRRASTLLLLLSILLQSAASDGCSGSSSVQVVTPRLREG